MPVSIYKPIGQTPNELIEIYKKENIKQLNFITSEDAIKIEKKNLKTDMWQTLFFVPKT